MQSDKDGPANEDGRANVGGRATRCADGHGLGAGGGEKSAKASARLSKASLLEKEPSLAGNDENDAKCERGGKAKDRRPV